MVAVPLVLTGDDDEKEGPPAATCERWSAWACVPLDQKPGRYAIDVHETIEGRQMRSRQTVVIVKKRFPEERLSVDQKLVTPPPEVEERIARERERVASVTAKRRPALVPSMPFQRPVPGAQTAIFGTRRIFNGTPRPAHPGLDLRAATGTPVEASGPGLVVLADDLYFSGKTVIIDHGGGLFTIYAHLSKILVQEGEAIAAGERLGLSGATGRVTGPHLHWGAKIGDRPFDPTALLAPSLFR